MSATTTQALVERTVRRTRPQSQRYREPEAFNAFLLALDPRGDSERSKLVRFALAASSDSRLREFLTRLRQPRYQRWSVAAIAKSCDLTFGEFVAFWQRAQVERAVAIAQCASPDVVRGLVSSALPKEVTCERCEGLGSIPVEAWIPPELVRDYLGRVSDDPEVQPVRACPWCEGAGKILKPGDVHAAGRVLAIAGSCKERPIVQINQRFAEAAIECAEELSKISMDVNADETVDTELSRSSQA